MADRYEHIRSLILGPGLCTVLLVLMSFETMNYRNEQDFEGFHKKAAKAIDQIPLVISPWMGQEEKLSDEERKLLKPNAYRCIAFSDTRASVLTDSSRKVILMVAQCKNAHNMEGHYPPVCYPFKGYINVEQAPRTWQIGDQTISGYEYRFEKQESGRFIRTTVYNFMVLPNQGIQSDMESVTLAAEDYEQSYYGAAQFQVVFGSPLAEPSERDQRDKIFSEIITPCLGVIQTLSDGATVHE